MTSHLHRPKTPGQERAEALEARLVEAGIITSEAVDVVIERFQNDIGPQCGAAMVARAWTDPDYKGRMLADGTAAAAEMG